MGIDIFGIITTYIGYGLNVGVSYDPDDWTWQEEVEIVGKKEAYKGNFDLWDRMELRKWRRLSDVIRATTSIHRLDIKMTCMTMTEHQEQNSIACIHLLYKGILFNSTIEDTRIE